MTTIRLRSTAHLMPAASVEAIQSRFAFRVAAHLTEQNASLSPDVTERLRFGRDRALARARMTGTGASQPVPVGAPTIAAAVRKLLGAVWTRRLAATIPVMALVGGLFAIQHIQDQHQIEVAADVDAALLADDLPPQAYSDAGFVEFLKTPDSE